MAIPAVQAFCENEAERYSSIKTAVVFSTRILGLVSLILAAWAHEMSGRQLTLGTH